MATDETEFFFLPTYGLAFRSPKIFAYPTS